MDLNEPIPIWGEKYAIDPYRTRYPGIQTIPAKKPPNQSSRNSEYRAIFGFRLRSYTGHLGNSRWGLFRNVLLMKENRFVYG